MSWVAVGVAGAGVASTVIGGVMANDRSQADRDAMMQQYQNAQSQFANVNVPDEDKQKLILQYLTQQGVITPEQIQQVQQNPSQMAGIQTDPRLATAQMSALDTMSKMGQTGLQAQDMAALNASRRQISGDEQSKDNSIIQNLAARGAAGGGLELATRLAAAQGAASTGAQQSDQTMAMAQNRMLQATAQAGQLGGQIQGQQFNQQAQQAAAQDAINRFNAQQAAATGAANVQANNQAQAANLAAKQGIANANVGTANSQQQYNSQLANTNFNQQMALASAKAGQNQNMGQALGQQANAVAGQWQNMGAGVGQAAMGAAGMINSNNQAQAKIDAAQQVADQNEFAFADGGIVKDTSDNNSGGIDRTKGMQPVKGATGASITDPSTWFANGGMACSYKDGGHVPGKAAVPGDSYKNDTVKAVLSPGEIVIPRSHAISKDLAKAYLDHLFKVAKGEK